MESFLNRYRSITILLLVVFAQLVLLAVQVKNDQDVRMIRVWTVTAVTPVARIIEGFRGGGVAQLEDAAAQRRGRRGGRPLAITGEKLDTILAALDGGMSKAAVCRNFGVKRTTLIETLARVGWPAANVAMET